MQPLEIDYTIYVATSRERLWEGLTTAEFTRRYWAEEIRSEWRIGSAVEAFALDGTLSWYGTLRLRLTHDRFDSDEAFFRDCRRAWPELLSSLKSLLESGNSLGFVYSH